MKQPGMVANSACGQLDKSLLAPENLVSRDRFGRPVPSRVSPLIVHTRAGSDWLMVLTREISLAFRDGVIVHFFIPSTATGSVIGSLSGHTFAYRWHSLSGGHQRKVGSLQSSSSNGYCLFRYQSRYMIPIVIVRLSF